MGTLYQAHEALSLEYEEGLTRSEDGIAFDLSAHLLWIGERTRKLDGSHIEFIKGIHNAIAVKVSHTIEDKEFVNLIRTLNP